MQTEDKGSISDGYHTFDELYEHRHMLFIALANSHKGLSWRSRLHDDGTMYDGYFIAGMELPNGMITYHLPMRLWFNMDLVHELERAPEYDGHTAADTVERLRLWLP